MVSMGYLISGTQLPKGLLCNRDIINYFKHAVQWLSRKLIEFRSFFLNMNLKNIEYKDHVTFIEFQTFFFNP